MIIPGTDEYHALIDGLETELRARAPLMGITLLRPWQMIGRTWMGCSMYDGDGAPDVVVTTSELNIQGERFGATVVSGIRETERGDYIDATLHRIFYMLRNHLIGGD